MLKRRSSVSADRKFDGQVRRSRSDRRRRRAVELGPGIGAEPLEVRALLSGQTVQLIKDVNTVETYPSNLTPAGSNLFYEVEDSSGTGQELVATTSTGTTVVHDFGTSSSGYGYSYSYSELNSFTAVGNSVYFLSAYDSTDLWTSDGTSAGTSQVTISGSSGSYVENLTAVGNSLIFTTTSYESSGVAYELWATTPGSSSATVIHNFGSSSVSPIATIGGTAYLSVGGDLWTTDGTSANTVELEDSSNNPIPAPDDVFSFQGQVDYVSIGTTSTTAGVLGSGGETPTVTGLPTSVSSLTVAGSSLYFTAAGTSTASGANTQLWVSNGTQAGTKEVEDFSSISASAVPSNLVAVGSSLFFTIEGSDGLAQLWTSNGTAGGTSLVKDLGVEPSTSYSYYGRTAANDILVPVGNTLYFTAFDSTHGAELWSDNVSTGTTQLAADIDPGPDSSDPQDLVAFGGQLYFSANDGSSPLTSQLWTYNGTTASKVASFSPGQTAGSASSLSNYAYTTLGQQILLALDDGIRGQALWTTNGTAAGTQFLSAVDPIGFAVLDNTAYFLGTGGGSTFGLWETNGTASGTSEVMSLSQYGRSYSERTNDPEIVVSGTSLYFTTTDGEGGTDLWASNGTAGGTSIVKDFAPATGSSGYYGNQTIGELTPFAGKLAFVASTGSTGPQVWFTNGSAAGTEQMTDLSDVTGAYGSSTVNSLTVAGGQLYFFASTPDVATSLWSINAQGQTTDFLLPNMPSSDPSQPTVVPTAGNLTALGSGLVFSLEYNETDSSGSLFQLWTTIGAAGGAMQIQPADGSSFSSLSNFVALGNQVLFKAQSSSGEEELWTTDGTSSGTTEVKVINPSSYGYYYYGYDQGLPLVSNGIVYFEGNDGVHGLELWQSDGTSAGTFMVDDINPGAASSDPMELGVVNGNLVITANDGVHGLEPMVLTTTAQESAPTIATIPTQDATVGEGYQLNLALYASDPNAPPLPLTYTMGAGAPAGLTIDPTTGLLSLTGSANQTTGDYTFTVTATDNSAAAQSVSETITLDILSVQPPILNTIDTQYIGAGHTFSLDVSQYATDPNYPPFPLTYELVSGPTGATINSQSGLLTWPTALDQPLTQYPFTVEVLDNSDPPFTASETFDVQVNQVSNPAISTIPTKDANAGTTVTIDLKTYASDPNTPVLPLTFTLGPGAPSGASIDPNTGVFTWVIPTSEATGPQSFTLIVSDDSTPANTASQTFSVDVFAANAELPPQLNSLPSERVTVGETQTVDLSNYASDPNTPPLPLAFSLSGAPSYASISSSGTLTLSPPAGTATGQVTFNVVVSDNESTPLTAIQPITINVSAVQPPVIETIPAQSVHIGDTLTLNLSEYSFDPNSPPLPLTYALGSGAPSGASISSGGSTLTWTPATGVTPGTYTIPFTVSDGTGTDQTVDGTVTVNVAAAGQEFPPVLQTLPQESVTVGETQTVNLGTYASDPNDPALPLTFSLSGAPSYASISSLGVLMLSPPAATATGQVTFDVTVSDDESTPLTATQPITVNVEPVFSPYISSVPAQGVTIGSTLTVNLAQYAHDFNSPPLPLTYALGTGTPSGVNLDPSTGVLTWTPDSSVTLQTYTITFTASNGLSSSPATGTVSVTVGAPGEINAPVLSPLPEMPVTVGETETNNLSTYAADPNTPPLPLTFSLSGAPTYASISSSGLLTLSPPADTPPGEVTFTVTVADNESTPQTASQTITVNVEALQPPVIFTVPVQSATIGQAFSLDLGTYAYDPNSPPLPLTFALAAGAPADATLASGGQFSWTPSATDGTGQFNIPYTVSDGTAAGQTVSGTLTINVSTASSQPPTFSTIPTQDITVGETLSLNAASFASDPDTAALPMTFTLGSTPTPPAGLGITPQGTLTWTPASGLAGQSFTVTIVATDTADNSGSTTVTIDALAVAPPSVSSDIPTQTYADGQTVSLDLGLYATDENTPALPLSYTLLTNTLPGATLQASSGQFEWTVPSDQPAGPVTVSFDVSDSLTSANPVSGSFVIDVSSDQPPVIATIPTTNAPVGQQATVVLATYASDPNTPAQTLTFALTGNPPTGATVTSDGSFTWTPPTSQPPGNVTIGFTATDTSGLSTSGSFVLDVIAPPVLASVPTSNAQVDQQASVNLARYASDPNTPVESLTYALTGTPPSGATITSAGQFTWTPPSSQPLGPVTVGYIVTDTSGLSSTGSFVVDVVAPPVIATIPAQNAAAGQPFTSFSLKPYATDPNGLALSFSLGTNAPSGATINPSSGSFSWSPPESQPQGPVTVDFTVTDTDDLSTSGSFTIDIVAAPVLQQVPTADAPVGRAFQVDLGQYTKDGNSPAETLSFVLNGTVPSGASVGSSGGFDWTPPTSLSSGPVAIDYTVTNTGGASASGTFTIDVVVPPVIQAIPTQGATIGQALSVNVASFTMDLNTPVLPLTYSLAAGAPSGASIDPTTGLFTWTPAAGQSGPATITVQVADNQSPPQTATQSFTVNVASTTKVVVPPVLTAVTQAASVDVGQTFTLNVSQLASDPNTPPLPLSYSLSDAPAGMTIDPSSGVLTWNVPADQRIGNDSATVTVSDNSSPPNTTSETLSFSVVDPSPPPTVASPTVSTKKGYSITLTFTQPVDPATASNPANYILTEAKKSRSKRKPAPTTLIGLHVSYNQATNQVTLKAAKKPAAGTTVTLTVIGGSTGIAKLTGLELAGNGSTPGTNYVATISGKKVTPTSIATGQSIVVRAARPALARVKHGATSEVRRTPSSGAPGGPLALSGTAGVRTVVFGIVPTETTTRRPR